MTITITSTAQPLQKILRQDSSTGDKMRTFIATRGAKPSYTFVIQNTDTTANIYFETDGSTATSSSLKIIPGEKVVFSAPDLNQINLLASVVSLTIPISSI